MLQKDRLQFMILLNTRFLDELWIQHDSNKWEATNPHAKLSRKLPEQRSLQLVHRSDGRCWHCFRCYWQIWTQQRLLSGLINLYIFKTTKISSKVCRAEACTFVCSETSSSFTKGMIIQIRSSDHSLADLSLLRFTSQTGLSLLKLVVRWSNRFNKLFCVIIGSFLSFIL